MTTETAKGDDVWVSLDRRDLYSLMNLGPIDDQTAGSVRLNVKISRIAQDAALSNDGFIQQLRAYEQELFSWFAKAPENKKAFIADPLAALKAATHASSELLDKIETMGLGGSSQPDRQTATVMPERPLTDAWKTELPNSNDAICVVAGGDALYAGSNGSIYQLRAADGRLLQQRETGLNPDFLPGISLHEVRLALSDDGKMLFVGSDGYAACFTTSNFELRWSTAIGKDPTTWTTELGSDTVNLLLNGKDLYAGTHGQVFKLNDDNGHILLQNDLKGRGNGDVCLALADDKTRLFIGTDGHALALSVDDLATLWQTRLEHTGTNFVTMVTRNKEVYAAGAGRLFKLQFDHGSVAKSSILKGRGKHDVRMQLSSDGKCLLLGTDGYALSVDATDLQAKWQTKLGESGSAVSVLQGGDVLYAGDCDRVFYLAISTGVTTFQDSLGGGSKQEMGMALSQNGKHLFLGCAGFVMQTPIAGDLSAGWQAIIATRQSRVNDTLRSLFGTDVIPDSITFPFTQDGKRLVAEVSIISAPEIIDGGAGAVRLRVALKGKIILAAAKLAVRTFKGYVDTTINLEKIQARIEQENAEDFLLSFELVSDDLVAEKLFVDIDLSHLKILNPLGSPIELSAAAVLAGMNDAADRIAFPLQCQIPKPFPVPVNGLALRMAYTNVPGDPKNDFLSILFGLAGDPGSFDLSPEIISHQADADTAFIFSNRLVMETIKAGISNTTSGGKYEFELSDDYPARISNTIDVKFDVPLVRLEIKRHHVQIFIHEDKLNCDVNVSYRNLATAMSWQTIQGKAAASFASENGNIGLTVTGEVDVPWTSVLNVMAPLMLVMSDVFMCLFVTLIDEKEDLQIVVPSFEVSSVATPAYVQICGKVNRRKKKAGKVGVD